MNNDTIKIARELIDEAEGDSLTVYECPSGKLTIGRGRNLEDRGITQAESDMLLANDVVLGYDECYTQFSFFKELSEIRKAVVIDLYHNLGLTGLLGFKKMLRAFQMEDYDEAANQLKDSRYWDQVGDRAKRNYLMIKFDRHYTKSEAKSYFTNQ